MNTSTEHALSFSLSDVVEEGQSGPSWAVVRLDRLASNLRTIRSHVGSGRGVLLPVKADAYGHGAVAVSRFVQERKLVEWLGVATVAEGLELRKAGVELPILKMSPALHSELEVGLRAGVVLSVQSAAEADAVQAAVAALRQAGQQSYWDGPVPVQLKIDTGMRRVGVEFMHAGVLAAHVAVRCPDLRVQGVFTHFAVADDPEPGCVAFTEEQIARFGEAVPQIAEALGYFPELVHAANSGGVLAYPQSWGSMVRPGILAYGYYPDVQTVRSVPVEPVLQWRAPISVVKTVAAGETVSYGRTWTTPRETVIATVPVGYADGYRRGLSNVARACVSGRSVPVVGRVCMDQLLLDLGQGAVESMGTEVVLLGGAGDGCFGADDMAQALGTISYEVLTGIGRRVRRTYVGE
ncbi:alanine racemase [Dermatophilus congolensis]|uniref:Alanine racemase n=1 Tax=Dermatophilus congolensis TaxID=1863 RepID=A0A239VLQ3_9MICO|nr:alanine racemase [Dermatophilus congolensis]SNV23251.1 Alanine racemase [Dermatophilus congolensis]